MLEIERMLNITITMPQICYFCEEEIVKEHRRDSDSLCFHSLDGNHDNWDPDNKVPTHFGCHSSFHDMLNIDPIKIPELQQKAWNTRRERYGPSGVRDPEAWRKELSEVQKGHAVTEETKIKMRESKIGVKRSPDVAKKVWKTRKERYGPSGMKPKEIRTEALKKGAEELKE